MRTTLKHIFTKIREGMLQEMWIQTKWIYQYVRQYWKAMIFYTLLGLTTTAVSLISSLISRDLVDIITGHQTGLLVRTFCLFIGFSIGKHPPHPDFRLCLQLDQYPRGQRDQGGCF